MARGAYQQRKPGRIIAAGAHRSQVADAPRLETHCPGAPNLTVHRPVGPECAPCWDNPSLSGSLPPGEWRTINFTAPPTLPGQWSVVGVGSKGWGRKEVNFNSSFARQLPLSRSGELVPGQTEVHAMSASFPSL